MLYYLLFLSFWMLPAVGGGNNSKPAPPMPEVTASVPSNPTGNVINIYNTTEVKNANTNQNRVTTSAFATLKEKLPSYEDAHQFYTSFIDMVKKNRWKIGGASAVLAYGAVSAWLVKERLHLEKKNGWSVWQSEYSVDQLLELPQSQLAEMLLRSVQAQYINRRNPTDFVMPLVRFVQILEEEEKQLARYIWVTNLLKQLHILFLFPTTQDLIEQAKARLQRLRIINHVFLSWTADYNVIMALQGAAGATTIKGHITRQCKQLTRSLLPRRRPT